MPYKFKLYDRNGKFIGIIDAQTEESALRGAMLLDIPDVYKAEKLQISEPEEDDLLN